MYQLDKGGSYIMLYKRLSLCWQTVRDIVLYPNYFWIINPYSSPVFPLMMEVTQRTSHYTRPRMISLSLSYKLR